MNRSDVVGGALLAAAASGPLATLLSMAVLPPGPMTKGLTMGLVVTLMAVPLGAVATLLPALAAAAALTWLGERHESFRQPLIWLAVGGLIGAGFSLFLFEAATPGTAPIVIAGGICGMLARWRVRWPTSPPGGNDAG